MVRAVDVEEPDYFASRSLIDDPYPYFDRLRGECPVLREPHHDVVMVTGHDEAAEVLADTAVFSSCNALSGPFPGFPVPLEGADVSEVIDAHRGSLPMSDELTTMDPPRHAAHRALVARYLTPKYINATEPFMRRLADRLIDGIVDRGRCEIITDYSGPFALLNICALPGVPKADHQMFVDEMLDPHRPLLSGSTRDAMATDPFAFLHERFTTCIEACRSEPRDDVMTRLANTPFPDGSKPDVMDAVRLASMLFIAGIGTTAGLLATACQVLGDRPDLQDQLREDNTQIPRFVEETLRFDGEVKGTFRLARTAATVGGADITAGSTVMVVVGAANRDPRRFEDPNELRVDRPNARQHLAFGHGAHVCVGAPLARVSARVGIETLLSRLATITISASEHGPAGARTYRHVPTYISRSLRSLHLEFTAADPQ
ncbi:MAG: cytochrome P450, partial [Acidimicrobiales bacterium]